MTTTTQNTIVRSYTNATNSPVYVLIFNEEPCSYLSAYMGKVNTWSDESDAEDIALEWRCDGYFVDVVEIGAGDTLDMDKISAAWTA